MEKLDINSLKKVKQSKKSSSSEKAEKGTVTIRQKGNSYEARIRLELKFVVEGVEKNPRLSRSGATQEIAKRRLAQLIVETYIIKQQIKITETSLFTEECENNLKDFAEFNQVKDDYLAHNCVNSFVDFGSLGVLWLNYKKEYINPSTRKKNKS